LKVVLSIDPVKFPLTGIGRYTYELAKGLQSADLDHLVFLRGYRIENDLPIIAQTDPMARQSAWKMRAQKNQLAVALYRRLNPWLKARALRDFEDYLFHGPNYYLPPFGGRSIVTIHDLSAYLWTDSHPPERVRYMQAEIELSLKRASALITDTEYTRHEVAKFFGWPLEKIHAVPLACSEEFRPRTKDELSPVLARYDLIPNAYALAIGTIEPRKNIETLIDAYGRLSSQLKNRFPLVLAGYTGWESEALHGKIKAAEREGWLRYLGFVPADDLPFLLSGARLFSFPSLYEGFGLPVLEAMASGIPVIASNASTLPEVTGGAALLHDPRDAIALTSFLEQGLDDDAWRLTARDKGLAQAAHFSWEKCTQQTLAAYRAVLAAN
jgi:glycosyltransferase involved in cell wall biosynthesis